MEIVITDTPEAGAVLVADVIERAIGRDRASVIGLATGSSPLLSYRELIRRHRDTGLSFADVEAFLLDEYVGLHADHPESYRSFIKRELTDHLDLPGSNLHSPDGSAADLAAAAVAYDRAIVDAGGVDVQILGIGRDGHIGFNEPSSSLGSRTRLKTLTEETRIDNSRFFDGDIDQVPRHCMTQGIGTILDARHIVMIANGDAKAKPVALAVEGPITAMVPASALQLHPHVTVIVDEAASVALTHADYYRHTYRNKPSWQTL